MTRTCPVCGSSKWEHFLRIESDSILTTDQRIIPGRLSKVICESCGVVANAKALSENELRVFYGEEYQLNTSGQEEHLFFTKEGPVPRSQVIHDWVRRHLPVSAQSLVEVGCGEGNVLQRFAASGLKVTGIEGSRRATELARSKGLDIINELIVAPEQKLPKADGVVSYGVLEHVEDIDTFLTVMKSAGTENSVFVFGLPVQDAGGYDLFFMEHVWHFTVDHVHDLLERRGFSVVHMDAAHPINHGFGLFVCVLDAKSTSANKIADPQACRAMQKKNRDHWLGVFVRANSRLADFADKRLAVYGSGEALSLLMAYTDLGNADIVMCIDEDPAKIGTSKHGIPVHTPADLAGASVDAVLLTVNPRYDAQIRAKLAPLGLPVVSCIA